MDSATPYKSKLRSYSRLSLSQGNTSTTSFSPYKTPLQRKNGSKRRRDPPPTPKANRSYMNLSDDTPNGFNPFDDETYDRTPKIKSSRKSRLSEVPPPVQPGAATKACQTDESDRSQRIKELEEENRKLKERQDMINKTVCLF